MMEQLRLSRLADIEDAASPPQYDPQTHGAGIVHIGVGAFHRAHQAVYTDDALARSGGDWRITGISLRGTEVADALNPQNGLYTLIERDVSGTNARVIGSIAHVIAATRDRWAPLKALIDPKTRIVTLTATEKAYGINRSEQAVDPDHPAIAADLAHPRNPVGVIGLLAEGLRLRRASGLSPFTVLCCDNLPDNGSLLRSGVVDFLKRTDPELACWVEAEVAFPSSMVDRITPSATKQTREDAMRLTGLQDLAAIETERFHQWVIEDHFPNGRPDWEAGGALFVDDVKPYELMKLRMLNGAHSMLAYAGFLSGHTYVRDVMTDAELSALVDRQMSAAAQTLPTLSGIDLDSYRQDLLQRFRNPEIAHETFQIAMDGTEKLPQRIFAPAVEAMVAGNPLRPFAFAAAAWMRYAIGRDDNGKTYELRDPRELEIKAVLANESEAQTISDALHSLPGLFDPRLIASNEWRLCVSEILSRMLKDGMKAAISTEAASEPMQRRDTNWP